MRNPPLYQSQFEDLSCCVLFPTYNNDRTLKLVLGQVLDHTNNIIVINDGSTDNTREILSEFPEIVAVHFEKNRGKGAALREGFRKAIENGYSYAVTMDSDGQHFSEDLHVFIRALEQKQTNQEILVIGSRKMDGPNIPQKSNVGNQFSSFWFWVETGIRLDDTQCGFRLYPLHIIQHLNLFTNKFELEIEVIVKAAWEGVKVFNLPVRVHYDSHRRITHFRPFMDVTRIILLNIYFILLGLCYILPRNVLRKFKKPSSSTTFLNNSVRDENSLQE